MKKLNTGLRYYQSLRLQNNLFNEVFAKTFNQTYMMVLVVGFTIAAYCSIRLATTMDLVSYIMFPGISRFIVVIIVIITGITGRIHDKSWAMISGNYNLLLNISGQPSAALGRKVCLLISLRLLSNTSLKVWLGDMYFMKTSTKLTLLAFLVNSTVYFLLTV